MALDPNIILQGQQADPLGAYGKALTLKGLMGQQSMQDMQLEQARQQQEQERTMADLYRGNIGPDGQVNRQGVLGAMAQRGLGGRIPGVQKQLSEADKASAELGQVKAKTAVDEIKAEHEKARYVGDTMARLASNPNVTHDDVVRELQGVPPQFAENAARLVRSLPGDPRQLRQYLLTIGLEADKRLAAFTPQFRSINAGDREILGAVDPLTGAFTAQGGATAQGHGAPGVVIRGATPGQQMLQDRFNARVSRGGGGSSGGGGKAPSGYRWAAGGALEPIPGGPADKGPGGASAPKLGAEVNRQITGILSLNRDLDALKAELKNFNPRSLDQLDPVKRARIESLSKQALMNAKEAAALGALTGPDMAVIEGILSTPTSARGVLIGGAGSLAQIDQVVAGNRRRFDALREQYGEAAVPPAYRDPAASPAQPARGGSQPARSQQPAARSPQQRAPSVSNW